MSIAPIRREILVTADPDVAFEVFTARISQWWPLAELSVFGAGATVAFDGDRIVETAPDGRTSSWGTVTTWNPPAAVAFTWHPGRDPERPSQVEVTFAAAGPETLVTLIHSGWESFADPATAREEYGHGWPPVLERYREAVSTGRDDAANTDGGETWALLVHRPGPDVRGSVFEDPRFADHAAFLGRMRQAGFLVAAGPLTDEEGTGATVLRLPGADRMDEATRLATKDDASVAGGFFTVTVRPWHVVMHA